MPRNFISETVKKESERVSVEYNKNMISKGQQASEQLWIYLQTDR